MGKSIKAQLCAAIALLGSALVFDCQSQTVAEELIRIEKPKSAVGAVGPELFGERVNLYNGGLEFVQQDVSLPGNGRLPVSVGRRLETGKEYYRRNDGYFGGWELEIPHLHGVFSKLAGWQSEVSVNGQASASDKRCSAYSPPPGVPGSLSSGGWFVAMDYWRGSFLYVPGVGDQELLVGGGSPAGPSDGQSYPLRTAQHWMIRCLPSLASGDAGEGFVAVSPDGTQYRFDWMARRAAPPVGSPSLGGSSGKVPTAPQQSMLQREEIWLLPTQVTDRHGNWVRYSFNPNAKWQLQRISASDGRQLTISYASGTNHIETVSDGTRTWRYRYDSNDSNGTLDQVELPDGTRWQLGGMAGMDAPLRYARLPSCLDPGLLSSLPLTGSMVHPNGTSGSFTLTPTTHLRKYSVTSCTGDWTSAWYFGTYSLTRKVLTGPGLPSLNWSFAYTRPPGSNGQPCEATQCPPVKLVEVTDPAGQRTRHSFGNAYDETEGLLLNTEEGWNGSQALRSVARRYRASSAGPYPAVAGSSLNELSTAMSALNRPLDQVQVSQQGQSFTWEATGFDGYARSVEVRKSGPGGTRLEQTRYADVPGLWVMGQLGTLTVAGQPAVENSFDAQGRLSSQKRFGILQFTQDHNSDGTLAWREDGKQQRTRYSSYQRGLPQRIDYADGSSESASVNDLGQVLSLTDAAGFTTGYGYDALGRLSSITPPSGWTPTSLVFEPVSSAEYGLPAGHWRQTLSQGNARTVTYYDGLWRPVMVRSFDITQEASTRQVVVKGYDTAGQLAFESYPQRELGSVSVTSPGRRMGYDALGRPIRTEADSEQGVLTSTQAYLAGFQTQFTNPRGKTSTQSFWALDTPGEAKLASQSLPEGVTVSISRDAWGKPTAISRGGVTRRYVYDAGQRLCKTIEPEINATVQDYDAAGNVAWRAPGQSLTSPSSCDTASVPSNAKISYGYDGMNRLKSTGYGDSSASITREYWPDGKLRTVESNGSKWSYEYNSLRLLSTETLSNGGQSFLFSWSYSPNGHVSGLSYPAGGPSVSYAPNALGEASQVGSFATSVAYHPNGALSSYRLSNGVAHTQTQNLRGLPETNQDDGVLKDAYTYDPNGNVTGITDQQENVFSRSMGYDGLDRMTSASAPGVWSTASYSYDAADNLRTANVGSRSVTLNYTDGTNRLNSVTVNGSTSPYAYDPNGNIKAKGGQTYSFDLGNRMSASSLGGSYIYDGLGRRIQTTPSGSSTARLTVYSQAGQLLWSTRQGTMPASISGYSCPMGMSLQGTQCVGTATEPATLQYSCPDASWTLSGQSCSKTETVEVPAGTSYRCTEGTLSGNKCVVTRSQAATPVMGCPAGSTPSGSQCLQEVADDYAATGSPSCEAGWSLQGSNCTRQLTTPATKTLECNGQGPLEAYAGGVDGQVCGGKKVWGVSLAVARNECAKGASQSGLSLLQVRYDGAGDGLVARALPGDSGNWSCLYQPLKRFSCSAGSLQGEQCVQTQSQAATTSYSCPAGGTLDGTMCRRKKTISQAQVEVGKRCEAGWTLQGSTCTKQETVDAQSVYGCADGSSPIGGMCRTSRTLTQGATSGYACRSGWTLSGQSCTASTSQAATPSYSCSSGTLSGSTCVGASQATAYVYLSGKLIAEATVNGTTQYVHTDALGSPVARTGPTGTLLSRTRLEPYGYVAQGTKPSPATSQIGFTGHVQDAETDLVYMQQRYYDPIAGRFLSVDPIATDANTGAGFGLYTYVSNNPYGSIDPDGRLSNDDCRKMPNCEVWVESGGGSTGWRSRAKEDGNYVSTALEQKFDQIFPGDEWILFPGLYLVRGALGTPRFLGGYMDQPTMGGSAVLAMAIVGKIGPAAKGLTGLRNGHLAGGVHPKTGIPFDRAGFPDFSGVAKAEVKISQTGSRAGDFRAANRAAGFSKTPEGYT